MRRARCRTAGLALLTGMLLTLSAPATLVSEAQACSLRVGWEPYAVYTFQDSDGHLTGADIELVRALGEELGCDLSFKELPWARVLHELEIGALDVATSASQTPEREAYARFSRRYRESEMAVYVRRGEAERHDFETLAALAESGFTLGVIAGYHYGDEFDALMRDQAFAGQVDPAIDYRTNIRKLLHGRIDGYLVEDVGVLVAEAEALEVLDQLERLKVRLPAEPLHLMFSSKSVEPALIEAVDAALLRMEQDGRLGRILGEFLKQ